MTKSMPHLLLVVCGRVLAHLPLGGRWLLVQVLALTEKQAIGSTHLLGGLDLMHHCHIYDVKRTVCHTGEQLVSQSRRAVRAPPPCLPQRAWPWPTPYACAWRAAALLPQHHAPPATFTDPLLHPEFILHCRVCLSAARFLTTSRAHGHSMSPAAARSWGFSEADRQAGRLPPFRQEQRACRALARRAWRPLLALPVHRCQGACSGMYMQTHPTTSKEHKSMHMQYQELQCQLGMMLSHG